MSQQTRNLNDDVVIQINGDKYPVMAGPVLRSTGWRGGIWVRYVTVPEANLVEEYIVEASDGNEAVGFLAFPSENYDPGENWGAVNNFTGVQLREAQGSVAGASTVTMTAGGGRFLFLVFETVALSPGGVRDGSAGFITYTLNENLKISENGFLCNDPDARLALVGVAAPLVAGKCCALPHSRNGFRLGLQLQF